MFVDACAIIAVLSDEPEAERISKALVSANNSFTSPIAVLETVISLARTDKSDRPITDVEPIVMEFLDERGITIRDLPPAGEATRLAELPPIAIERVATASISATAYIMHSRSFSTSRF